MPILAKQNEYVLPITYECNLNCSYCAIRNSHDYRKNITLDDIMHRIDRIPSNSIVTLTGGEPGLVEREIVQKCIEELQHKKCELYLETNGLFIEKYPELIARFKEVLYHCTVDMNDIIKFQRQNFRYMIIVNDENIHNLESFINRHPNILFDIIECTYPFEITGPTLSKANKNMIMTKYCSHMTCESIRRMIHEKEFEKITWLM